MGSYNCVQCQTGESRRTQEFHENAIAGDSRNCPSVRFEASSWKESCPQWPCARGKSFHDRALPTPPIHNRKSSQLTSTSEGIVLLARKLVRETNRNLHGRCEAREALVTLRRPPCLRQVGSKAHTRIKTSLAVVEQLPIDGRRRCEVCQN